ncbi:MAG: hypothetical protein AB1782_14465 [Cyanobacteriota bacterium]
MREIRKNKGITVVELAICMIFIAVLAAIAVPRMADIYEDADAASCRSVAADLEAAVSQGLSRGVNLSTMLASDGAAGGDLLDDIVNEIVQPGYDGTMVLTIPADGQVSIAFVRSSRAARVDIDASSGKVTFDAGSLSGFTNYSVNNGDLVK